MEEGIVVAEAASAGPASLSTNEVELIDEVSCSIGAELSEKIRVDAADAGADHTGTVSNSPKPSSYFSSFFSSVIGYCVQDTKILCKWCKWSHKKSTHEGSQND